MSIALRLKEFAEKNNFTISGFEKQIGVGNGAISKAFDGKRDIGLGTIEKFVSKYPEVSLEWLILGSGDQIKKPLIGGEDQLLLIQERDDLLIERNNLQARIKALETNDVAQNAQLYALEEFVLKLAQEVRKTGRKSQSVILSTLVGDGLRVGLGKNNPRSQSVDIPSKPKKTAKAH